MSSLLHEVIQGARVLGRERRYALMAVATTAIGIAAATTTITVARQVLLAPLSYAHADHLAIVETQQETRKPFARVTGGDFVDLQRDLKSLDAIAYFFGGDVGVQFGDRAAFVPVAWTTTSLFRVFSIVPDAGRLLAEGASDEAVVNEAFATRQFGTPAAALGRRVSVENKAYTIVGVVPPAFHFPRRTDLWVSTSTTPENINRTAYNYQAVALVRADGPLETAQRELGLLAARLEQSYRDTNRGKTLLLVPLREYLVGDMRPTLYLLLASVIVLLLIACANVANLQLARGMARNRELAIRAALGADRWALARATVGETLAVGIAGAVAGVAAAAGAIAAVARWAPGDLPRAGEIRVDGLVMATAAVLAIATGIISGLAPARQLAGLDLGEVMREEGERTAGGGRASRFRQWLVGGEVALAFVLAVTATLLVRSLGALDRVDLGFDPGNVLVMYAHEPARTDAEYDHALAQLDLVIDRARAIPGVQSAAAVMGLPAGRYGSNGSYAVEGRQRFAPGERLPEADFSLASPGYFQTMGIRVERGRDFSPFDSAGSLPVVIVSESVAREQFGSRDPIGHRIMCGLDDPTWMTIVGVVADIRHSPGAPPSAELYMPLTQHKFRANELQLIVRGRAPAGTLAAPMRAVAAEFDPNMAVSITTLDAMLRDTVATPRARTLLMTVFGAIALLLAISGVYGVMSYSVLQRTREFAVRLALGATRRDVLTEVLAGTARIGIPALAAGAIVAALAGRLFGVLLFGVTPLDPLTWLATATLVTAAALAAAAAPAWRAASIDPAETLRQ